MQGFDTSIIAALTDPAPKECPIRFVAPRSYYRADQVRKVPEKLQGLVALVEELRVHPNYNIIEFSPTHHQSQVSPSHAMSFSVFGTMSSIPFVYSVS